MTVDAAGNKITMKDIFILSLKSSNSKKCSEVFKIIIWTCFRFMRFGLKELFQQYPKIISYKTIYEINMCKSQYEKDFKKPPRVNGKLFSGRVKEALVKNDSTTFISTVCFSVIFIFFVLFSNFVDHYPSMGIGVQLFLCEGLFIFPLVISEFDSVSNGATMTFSVQTDHICL